MNLSKTLLAILIGASALAPVHAQSLKASEASVGASVGAGMSAAWVAHEGSEFVVQGVRAVSNGVELSLRGAGNAIETTAFVAGNASVAVGTSVKVVAESTGYALMAAGRMIAYVPNEIARDLLHQSRR